jgi:HK97 family phage major capsid protein
MPLTNQQIDELKEKLGLTGIQKDLEAQKEQKRLEREQAEKAQREEEETARMKALVDEATGEQKEKLETALELVKALTEKLGDSDVKSFAKTLEELQTEVASKSDEISQLMNARMGVPAGATKRAFGAPKEAEDLEKMAENAMLLGYFMDKKDDVLDTVYGKSVIEKVNQSSNIEVSSDEYETIFSTRILRDIQQELVVGNLFQEVTLNSASLRVPIEPTAGMANWVAAATYGTDATTGNEVDVALTEITLSTFKLAAKVYLTDETTEDAIIPLLPILRRHLVEAHARAIEQAFMSGTGSGQPAGLIGLADTDSNVVTTTATHDGATKVAASMLQPMRRELGRKGLRMNDLVLIVSMDAYYDLLEDTAFADVDQVGNAAIKLQGQVGRVYGMPVVVSEWFPAKVAEAVFSILVYTPDFVVPRLRQVTVERERRAREQRDAYYATQRLNLQRYFTGDNVASAQYAA